MAATRPRVGRLLKLDSAGFIRLARCLGGLAGIAVACVAASSTSMTVVSASSGSCQTTSFTTPTAYSMQICIVQPAPAAVMTGNVSITATAVAVAGKNPGVVRMVTTLGSGYVITQFNPVPGTSPPAYTFTLPTAKWADGSYGIVTTAIMKDNVNTASSPIVSVQLSNGQATAPVNTNLPVIVPGTIPPAGAPLVVATVGDGAGGDPATTNVANLVAGWSPNLFLYLGDVYEKGSATEFLNSYDPTFGRLRAVTNPIVGNHEYSVSGNNTAPGYADYWNNEPDYYSYDAGGWHFIALNSSSQFQAANSANWTKQLAFLQQDLANHAGACIVAYWHHPLYDIGSENAGPLTNPQWPYFTVSSRVQDFWNALGSAQATLILNGHDHTYQRWLPMDTNGNQTDTGMTQFIVGMGGHSAQVINGSDPRVGASQYGPSNMGALKLSLFPTYAQYQYFSATKGQLDPPAGTATIPCKGYGTVTGTVTDSLTGLPVAGTTVSANGVTATTATNGSYTLNKASLGSYPISATAAGYVSNTANITVNPAATTQQNLALTPQPGSITGTVRDSVTNQPIVGAQVAFSGGTTSTDANGTYSFSGVGEGSYTLTSSVANYATQAQAVTVSPGANSQRDIGLAPLPGSIAGTVSDAQTRAPLPSATVSYSAGSSTSMSSGGYSLTNVTEGTYTVTASASGYSSLSQSISVGPGAAVIHDFALAPLPGGITGTVTDSLTGKPIGSASVSTGNVTATSASNGSYTLSNLTEGSYTVTASVAGYQSVSVSATVNPGVTTQQALALTPLPGSVLGTVSDSTTTLAISGATVSINNGTTTTDANGAYNLANLTEGSYSLTISASGYFTQTQSVTVQPGSATRRDVALVPLTGTIGGIVADSVTGLPVAGARLSTGSSSAVSDTTGSYLIADLPPGPYLLTTSATGYTTQSQTVNVSSGARTSVNLSLAPLPGTITGIVRDATTSATLAGATVAYSGGSTITDSTGRYSLTGVIEGSYSLSASLANYQPATSQVTVGPGATTAQDAALAPVPGTITGVVTGADTAKPIGASVTAGSVTASTDASGSYSVTGLPEGAVTLSASAPGYATQTMSIAVGPGAVVHQDLVLLALPGNLTGTVTDGLTGQAVTGATVATGSNSSLTGTTGGYALTNLTAGSYQVSVTAGGFQPQQQTIVISRGATTGANFALTPLPGSISGTVSDSVTSQALSGAAVSAAGLSTTTDISGSYSLGGVAEGSYSLAISLPNYTSQTLTVTVGPGASVSRNVALIPMPGTVAGTVTDSVTGQPLTTVAVAVAGRQLNTDATGAFSFGGLQEGSYSVSFTKSGYSSQTLNTSVAPNGNTILNSSLVPLPATLTGTVTDSVTNQPVSGAAISYSGGSTVTSGSGAYTITGVQEGSYQISASASGYAPVSQSATAGPGQTVTTNIAIAPLAGSVTGSVTDVATGLPISGASISYSGGAATTNSAGSYNFAGVTEGTYQLTATRSGYTTRVLPVTVGPGALAQLNFQLTAPLLADGFETGNMSAWSSNAGIVVQSTTVHAGAFATEELSTVGSTYARKNVTSSTNLYYRVYFNARSDSVGTANLFGYRTSTASVLRLYYDTNGRLNLRNDVTGSSSAGPVVGFGNWHSLELHAVINGSTSIVEAWLDGNPISQFASSSANLGTAPITQVQLGENQTARSYDILFDDVIVQSTSIGP